MASGKYSEEAFEKHFGETKADEWLEGPRVLRLNVVTAGAARASRSPDDGSSSFKERVVAQAVLATAVLLNA